MQIYNFILLLSSYHVIKDRKKRKTFALKCCCNHFIFHNLKAICYLLCNLNVLSSLRRQPEGVFAKGHASPGTRLNMREWSSKFWHLQKDDPNGNLCNERLMLKWKLPGNLLSISISIKFPWLALRSSDLNQTIITGHRTWNVLFGKNMLMYE